MADTGNGASITFGTSSLTLAVESIDIGDFDRQPIPVSTLSTTGQMESDPGDLEEVPEISIVVQWDQSYSTFPATTAAAETITLTYPLKSGESTAATFAGTGMIIRVGSISIVNGDIMRATIVVKMDGKTGPTSTAGS